MTVYGRTKTARPLSLSQTALGMPGVATLLMIVILLTGCERWEGSATMEQAGKELNETLPTVSENDTEQTITENANFREIFFSIWPMYRPRPQL